MRERGRPDGQHGEQIEVIGVASASELGGVVEDVADLGTDQRPIAHEAERHQIADPQRERHVRMKRPVDIHRPRVGGLDGYPPPRRLQRVHDRQEAFCEVRMYGRPSRDSPMLAHPSLAERFLAIVGSPELIWQAISPTTNRLLADLRREQRHYPVDHPWMDQLLLEVPSCQTARRTKPCLWEHKRECRLGGTAVEKCSL